MQTPGAKPKQKISFKMTKSEWIKLLVMLIVLYVALAPVFAMGLYNHLIFLPYREQQDLTPYFPKVESLTNSKMSYLTIPSGHAKLNAWYFKKTGANKITIVNTATEEKSHKD